MNPESEPSEAESALRAALQASPPVAPASEVDRQGRLRNSFRFQTAAHDLGHFVCSNLFGALGKLLLGLWRLASNTVEPPRNDNDLNSEDDDTRP